MTGHDAVPPLVAAAASRAREAGFPMSCDPAVGRLLAVLAAHLPARAKVVELGTVPAWALPGHIPMITHSPAALHGNGTTERRSAVTGAD
jgi:hypothetical protein